MKEQWETHHKSFSYRSFQVTSFMDTNVKAYKSKTTVGHSGLDSLKVPFYLIFHGGCGHIQHNIGFILLQKLNL